MEPTHNEVWRPVVGYEGIYEVSDQGRVRSVERLVTRSNGTVQKMPSLIRTLTPSSFGHLWVTLRTPGTRRNRTVHSLILEAFAGPRPAGAVARHLNGNPSDNRVENLAWGTPKENGEDMTRHGSSRNSRKTHCLRGHPFDGDNLIIDQLGRRICRQCKRIYQDRRNARRREKRKQC